jgi:hypothetical protein
MWTSLKLSLPLLLPLAAFANEPHKPAAFWAHEGYKPVKYSRAQKILAAPPVAEHSLSWPVEFADDMHTMGNNMIQFQQYGGSDAYYHAGCDLRAQAGSWVSAPIGGRVEAGHYGYETQADGSDVKWWKPYPAPGDTYYFEVAVIDDTGTRFEIHHVDENSLPPEIISAVQNGGRVKAGDHLGKVVLWPEAGVDGELYNHVHFNVVDKSGVHWNPERLAPAMVDTTAPVIHGVYAKSSDGHFSEVQEGAVLTAKPDEFVVAATDQREKDVYTQAPNLAELVFNPGTPGELSTRWDFTWKLTKQDGSFPPIWELYLKKLTLPSGERLSTEGNYQTNFFLIQLKTPPLAQGPFVIRVGDMAGNQSEFHAELR